MSILIDLYNKHLEYEYPEIEITDQIKLIYMMIQFKNHTRLSRLLKLIDLNKHMLILTDILEYAIQCDSVDCLRIYLWTLYKTNLLQYINLNIVLTRYPKIKDIRCVIDAVNRIRNGNINFSENLSENERLIIDKKASKFKRDSKQNF